MGTTSITPTVAQQIAFSDAYWAAQPEAVQKALKGVPYSVAKVKAAQSLVSEGYIIDNTIMVWGWDPLETMLSREQYGYTWVPSAGMPPIQIAPGLSQGTSGPPPYDAAVAPAGAIIVTTDPTKLAGQYPAPATT